MDALTYHLDFLLYLLYNINIHGSG